MKTDVRILPGIARIGWVEAEHLPAAVALHGICGNPVPVLTRVHWMDFYGEPDCRCVSEKSAGGYTDTATLKFSLAALPPLHLTLAFVVEDNQGSTYLVGQREAPLARIKAERLSGTLTGEAAGYRCEVTHAAVKCLVPCVLAQ